jgi:hypothetical protein
MTPLATLFGLFLIGAVLWDVFETILLPRRSSAQARFSRLVMRFAWIAWSGVARRIPSLKLRETFLSFYPILSLLVLLAVWAVGLMAGFALLQLGTGASVTMPGERVGFMTLLYLSGSTFLTLGMGDVRPLSGIARTLTIIEAGTGFAYLAVVLSYLPVLYNAFSRREVRITMLDEWAGSPPSAAVALRRNAESDHHTAITSLLREWEVASAELLESHLSYPVLAYFRSQHDNQSWLGSLTAMLDTCALVVAGVEGVPTFQARLTFAIARHAVVDLSQVFRRRPRPLTTDRLSAEEFGRLRDWLERGGVRLTDPEAREKLADLRSMYEPYVAALSDHLMMPLPGWLPPERVRFNWETTVWAKTGDDTGH